MRIITNNDYFFYNEFKIDAVTQTYIYDKDNYGYKFVFEYKNVKVEMFYEEEDNWYSLASIICKVIEEYGKEGYEQFKEKYHDKKMIEDKYIVVDNKVYKPYVNDSIRSGSLIRYIIEIQMNDNKILDGIINGDMKSPFYDDVFDKDKLIATLRNRVQNYFSQNNILPKDEFLQNKDTEKYLEISKWLSERNISF